MEFKMKMTKLTILGLVFQLLYIVFVWALYAYYPSDGRIFTPLVLTAIPVILFALYFLRDYGKIIITDTGIEYKSPAKNFSIKSGDIKEIRRHKRNSNSIYIVTELKKYFIPINVDRKDELVRILTEKFNFAPEQ